MNELDKETLDWMLKQTDAELVGVLFNAGRINDLAYWKKLMPALRASRPEGGNVRPCGVDVVPRTALARRALRR